jgi:hypothetical protein
MPNPIGPDPAACRFPPLRLVEMRHHDAVLAGVAGDNPVLRQAALQFADHPLRQYRHVVGEVGAVVEVAVALAMGGHALLGILPTALPGRSHRLDQLTERHRGVGDQHVLGRIIPRRIARLDVDLDKGLAHGVEQCPVFPRGIARRQFRADDEHEVGLGHTGIARFGAEGAEHPEGQRVGLGKAALAGGGRRHRQPGGLRQPPQLVIGLGDAHSVAGDHHRLLRCEDRLGGGLD